MSATMLASRRTVSTVEHPFYTLGLPLLARSSRLSIEQCILALYALDRLIPWELRLATRERIAASSSRETLRNPLMLAGPLVP